MTKCFPQPIVLQSAAVTRRKFWLIATCIVAFLFLAISEPALAQCTGSPNGVTCPVAPPGNPYSFGFAGNPYSPPGSAGINVNTTNTPINVTLQPGVIVNIPPGPGSVNAVNAANTAPAPPGPGR